MSVNYQPSVVASNLLLNLDFFNTKSYIGSGTNALDIVSKNSFVFTNPSYYSFINGYMNITRSASTPKTGGEIYSTLSGNLTSTNFLYNDHTWEVWFKIDDITNGAYDANEGYSNLTCYRGYHSGFLYTSSTMYYYIWNGISSSPTCASWTLGTSSSQINQGQWYQIAVVKSGSSFIPYINGSQLGSGFSPTLSSTGQSTSNEIHIGGVQKQAAGAGSYCYYSKNNISNIKMYNRALTAQEIQQNYNALRGRFGL